MKLRLLLVITTLFIMGCKQNISPEKEIEKLTIAEKIANANGFDNWKNVKEIQFTFNVDRDSSHFERSWIWNPKSHDVTMAMAGDTVAFNHKMVDSVSMRADRSFINDKYWLLAPFNLIWDEGTTITSQDSVMAPLSNKLSNKLTITYGSEGGYTPGDAYDFFYDSNFMINEWVFRRGNQDEPSMITSWEDYEDFNGIKISKTRNGKDNAVKLYFTGLKVVTE